MESQPLHTRRRGLIDVRWMRYAIWFLAVAVLLISHTRHLLNSDEGVILAGAWNLLNGQRPYEDFFAIIPPGSFYLVHIFWTLAGDTYAVAAASGLIGIMLGAIGVERICWLVTGNRLSPVAALLFILPSAFWPLINHNTFNITLVIWATYFVIRGLKNGYRVNFWFAGVLIGLSMLFLHHRALAALGAFLICLLIRDARRDDRYWGHESLPFLFFSLGPPSLLFLFISPTVLWDSIVVFPATHYLAVNDLPLTVFFIFFAAVSTSTYALRKNFTPPVLTLILLHLFLMLSVLPRPDIFHLLLVVFPLYALSPLIWESVQKRVALERIVCGVGISIPPAFVIFLYVFHFGQLLQNRDVEDMRTVSYVREQCGESDYLYAGPFLPGLYFETRKLNPSAYDYIITEFNTESQFLEVKHKLAYYKPTCAVLNYANVEKFGYQRSNVVDEYIMKNYEVAFRDRDFIVMRRNQGG